MIRYLRANGFKVFIVTSGGIDFVRSFSEEAYEIPPERVIGSSIKTRFEVRDVRRVLEDVDPRHSGSFAPGITRPRRRWPPIAILHQAFTGPTPRVAGLEIVADASRATDR